MDPATLEQTADGPRLRFVRELAHPPEKVWRALTEPAELAEWFPDTIEVIEWSVGAPLRFGAKPEVGGGFEGEVLSVEPPALLAFRWGTDVLRFELEPTAQGTRLTLFDAIDDVGKAARDGAGWHVCLDRLELHADGREVPFTMPDRWREVHPSYVQQLGPEAATIGPPPGALD